VPPLHQPATSARALTAAAYISFIPIGIVTILLGPMLPILSARWSLNYSQAGALFTVQYLASTCAVAASGFIAARRGYRFAINAGLILTAAGLATLLAGPKILGILSIGIYGIGQGLAVPAANLLVADVNPARRSATLNLLNFFWSIGAVSCPFLVAFAAKMQHIPLFLAFVSSFSLLVALGIALMPANIAEPASQVTSSLKIDWPQTLKSRAFLILAALFFLYVGTENGFGGWVASYAKSLGELTPAMSLITPAFFYAALTLGRLLAPLMLRVFKETQLARIGLLLSCAGMAGLIFSRGLFGVSISACIAGLGLSCVYPITIALLSTFFGAASSQLSSLLFVLSNIGGGLLPWIVGVSSNNSGSLKAGLLVPLVGCTAMLILYLGKWTTESASSPTAT
jgi:MFS transporter, FHS family, glucose/mannose:H+ symporter